MWTHYLYRAVDKQGKTVDFLLRPDRGIAAAQAFFRKALVSTLPRVLRKVTLDGHVPSRRTNKYLNSVIEQDRRAIKRRCDSTAGFKSFHSAAITLAGIELAHRVRKRQFSFRRGRQRCRHAMILTPPSTYSVSPDIRLA